MHITPYNYPLPKTLRHYIAEQRLEGDLMPGLIVGVKDMLDQQPHLYRHLPPAVRAAGAPCLLVPPHQLPAAVGSMERAQRDDLLRLLKAGTCFLAEQINKNLGYVVDGLWVVYDGAKLWHGWGKQGKNLGENLFELAGLMEETALLAGHAFNGLKLPEEAAGKIEIFVNAGGAVCAGKVPTVDELVPLKDKSLEVILQSLKLFGVALDPSLPAIRAVPVSVASKREGERAGHDA